MEVTLASTVSANKNLDEDANTNTELLKHSCRVLLLYLMPRTTSRNGKSISIVDDQTLSIAAVTAATRYQARVELDRSSILRKVIAEKIKSGASALRPFRLVSVEAVCALVLTSRCSLSLLRAVPPSMFLMSFNRYGEQKQLSFEAMKSGRLDMNKITLVGCKFLPQFAYYF